MAQRREHGQKKVHIRNKQEFWQKIDRLIEDGPKKLQVVTDFDYTLTKRFKENGDEVMSSFSVFWECDSILEIYRVKDKQLAEKYRKYERDNTLNLTEKTRYMEEWYNAAINNLRGLQFPRAELLDVGRTMVECFRDGAAELFSWLSAEEVPMLLFSAGLGDAISAVLEAAGFLTPNIKVVSNFLEVGQDGKIAGIDGMIIHTLNKNERAIKNTDLYDQLKERSNVILMGDSLADAGMVDGMDHSVVLKVGYLQDEPQINLDKYLDVFDVVLVRDNTLNVINTIKSLIQYVGK